MTQSFLSRVIESFHDHNQSTDRLDSASVAWDREIISKHTAKTSPLPFPRPHSGFGLNAVKQLTAIPPVFDLRLATANSVQILISLSLFLWRALGISPENLTFSLETEFIETEGSENSSGDEENRRRERGRERKFALVRENLME